MCISIVSTESGASAGYRCRSGSTEEDQNRDDAAADGQDNTAVWSWDFVHDVTRDDHAFYCLTVNDEKTHWCLAIEVAHSFSHKGIIAVLPRLIAR